MIKQIIKKIFKNLFISKNEKKLNQVNPIIEKINSIEPSLKKLNNEELKKQTSFFQNRINNGEPLNNILPEAFATVRETSFRTINQRHFDTQLIGGIVLHEGNIAEMQTGEGKTLAATLTAYLNALSLKGVHIVTVNDYLASRDSEWMGEIYRFLNLTVNNLSHDLNDTDRKKAYKADITYGSNNEFGFDYLRDNMKFSTSEIVQRNLEFAIIDEIDSILIDESRTPLIISGLSKKNDNTYKNIDKIFYKLDKKHYSIDEKNHIVNLTEKGITFCEKILHLENLYNPQNLKILHHIEQTLKAHTLFNKNIDYIIKNKEILIIDEFTGRSMPGRRYSDGLHQALEAKEKLPVKSENQTLASITFQNYFKMYNKLAGMTGTAKTESEEFLKIYQLKVISIPCHKPMIRINESDVIYKTKYEKYTAVVKEIKELYNIGQPILIGTINIKQSEEISLLLKQEKIPHFILNAKNHAKEAEIIAQAGQFKTVTISTNMAGRGTDIILGGNPNFLKKSNKKNYEKVHKKEREKILQLGGLRIIGTERHESRRIDNQLRGRAGRQGDPGSSRFYLSLEDDLLRLFGAEKVKTIVNKLGVKKGTPIKHSLISKSIENAQKKIENQHFNIRKQLLEFDNVLNKQREIIYAQRRLSNTTEIHNFISKIITDVSKEIIKDCINKNKYDWNYEKINHKTKSILGFSLDIKNNKYNSEEISQEIESKAKGIYNKKIQRYEQSSINDLERFILLQTIDDLWKEHLLNIDSLREGINLRSYGQKDPLREYQREAAQMFNIMINQIKIETISKLFSIQIREKKDTTIQQIKKENKTKTIKIEKIGRNSPCPCNSGLKYKKCCGSH